MEDAPAISAPAIHVAPAASHEVPAPATIQEVPAQAALEKILPPPQAKKLTPKKTLCTKVKKATPTNFQKK